MSAPARLFTVLTALALALPATAPAQGLEGVFEVEIRPGWRTDEGTHMAALHVRLAPGWKTYWRAPGDAGIPPDFDWQGSENITGAAFHWPAPEVIWQNGTRSIGYADELILPIEITPGAADAPARMAGIVQLGVCEEVCIPVQVAFDAVLDPGAARDAAIVGALVDRPMSAAEAGVGTVTCEITPTDRGLAVSAQIEIPPTGQREEAVIEAGDPAVWVSEPELSRDGSWLTARAEMVHVSGGGFGVDRSALRFTLLGADRAVDILGCQAPG